MTVYNPKLIDCQFSEAAIWLSNGPPDQLNSIQVGWTVNPILYGDFRTRLFGYWTVDGFKQTGCFDMRCSGFVQRSKELTLGSILEPTSNETHQYENPFNVFLDKTGNWWLSARDMSVGYWPSNLFTSMSSHAADLAFGGVTYNDPNKNPPLMSTSLYPSYNTKTNFLEKKYICEYIHMENDA
ncbi:hypothetical protein IFM89_009382 [Coptis chinensis]|uniref:Neprosin PEP catalytic domain-containing protein n=1 Tax=Coptis chinensis TaxID=261450 RepID=A0A835HLD8_9MAGN|nr:hypothetical protein IFM89_009382 [Coptis chinensis]